MITEQDKLKEFLSKSPENREYLDIVKNQQETTIDMLKEIEMRKEQQKQQKIDLLLNRIDTLEKQNNSYNYQQQYSYLNPNPYNFNTINRIFNHSQKLKHILKRKIQNQKSK